MHLLTVLLAALAVAACAAESSVGFLEEEKRAPSMGFSGMRGKKDDILDSFDKRSRNSLGFSGMRGKKSDDLEEDTTDDGGVEKRSRNNLGFSGMRGKKDDYEEGDGDVGVQDKRARNNLGFSGMRGKKQDSTAEDLDDEVLLGEDGFEKRARNALGFSGMRGKKASSSDEFVMDDLVDKRASGGRNSLGFSGMRGKKALIDEMDAYLAKRARGNAGFVGMRGRRENNQAFFGMRGKRGDGYDEDAVFGYLQSPDAARNGVVTFRSKRYLPSHWQLRNSKKAPFSGFIGLRGKKSYMPAVSSFRAASDQ